MSVGAGVTLLLLGVILVWAVDIPNPWVDLEVVGWILIGAGAVGVLWTAGLSALGRFSARHRRLTALSRGTDKDPRYDRIPRI